METSSSIFINGLRYFVTFIDDLLENYRFIFLNISLTCLRPSRSGELLLRMKHVVSLSASGRMMEVNTVARNLKNTAQKSGSGESK